MNAWDHLHKRFEAIVGEYHAGRLTEDDLARHLSKLGFSGHALANELRHQNALKQGALMRGESPAMTYLQGLLGIRLRSAR